MCTESRLKRPMKRLRSKEGYWGVFWLLWLTTALTAAALFSRAFSSASFKGNAKVVMTPSLPNTAGRLRQQPRFSCQWLTGRTWRASKRIDSHMEETTAPIPYAVAPLAAIMEYALSRVASAILGKSEASTKDLRGLPPTVADDQATLMKARRVNTHSRTARIRSSVQIGCRHARPRHS